MQPRSARFGGELAPILFHTLNPSAFFVGSLCGGIVFGLVVLMGWLQVGRIAPLVAQAAIFLFVIRVALNSAHGPNALGGVFKATGSDWPSVLSAVGRLMILNVIWAVPMVIMGSTLSAARGALLTGGGLGGPAALMALGLLLLPPLFLVSSVAAQTLKDLFDPEHWKSVFGGRWPDVVALFVAYVGGVLAAAGLSFMIGGSLGNGKPGPTLFFMMVAGAYSMGVFLLLLGRLVGGFLRTAGGEVDTQAQPDLPAPDRHDFLDEEEADDDRDYEFEGIADEGARREATEKFHQLENSRRVRPVGSASGASGPVAVDATRAGGEESLSQTLRRLQRLAETEPEQALEELEGIIASQGPHPTVLGRIAMLQKTIDPEQAMNTARQAASLAMKVGNIGVLGEMYEVFRDRMNELGVPTEQWQNVAAGQQALGKTAVATELYGKVLGQDPTNLAAIKGLIQIADGYLKSETGAEEALAIYEGLEKMCPDHPFVEFVERGRDAASRRLARAR